MYQMSRHGERGQSLVLIAVAAVALIAFVSLAIDGGMAYNQRRVAQNAADAAAIAGTYEIRLQNRKNSINQSNVRAEIIEAIQLHGVPLQYASDLTTVTNVGAYYTNDKGQVLSTCQIGSCSSTVASQAWGAKVDVANPFDTFFGGVIGWHQMNPGASSIAVTHAGARSATGYWAIVATNTDPQGQSAALQIQGGGQMIYVSGSVHSNGDFDGASNQNWKLNGQITYNGTCQDCEQSSPTAKQQSWSIVYSKYADYEKIAIADGFQMSGNVRLNGGTLGSVNQPITYINGDFDCSGAVLYGLIVVTGQSNLDTCTGRYMLASNDDIVMTGGVNMLLGDNGVYQNSDYEILEKNGTRFITNGNYTMRGSSNNVTGTIIAEQTLNIMGSSNRFYGSLIGNYVQLAGAGTSVTYQSEYFPPQPDYIELLQ